MTSLPVLSSPCNYQHPMASHWYSHITNRSFNSGIKLISPLFKPSRHQWSKPVTRTKYIVTAGINISEVRYLPNCLDPWGSWSPRTLSGRPIAPAHLHQIGKCTSDVLCVMKGMFHSMVSMVRSAYKRDWSTYVMSLSPTLLSLLSEGTEWVEGEELGSSVAHRLSLSL